MAIAAYAFDADEWRVTDLSDVSRPVLAAVYVRPLFWRGGPDEARLRSGAISTRRVLQRVTATGSGRVPILCSRMRGLGVIVGVLAGLAVPASAMASAVRIVIQAPSHVTAGQAVSVTVELVGRNSQRSASNPGTIQFSSSDPRAVLPRDFTFAGRDHGIRTFRGVVLTSAGSQTLTVGTRRRSLRAVAKVTVRAAAPAFLTLTVPASSAAGATLAPSVVARDRFGNPIGVVTAQTTFSLSPDGSCAGANCRATVAGVHTLSAVDGAASGSASVSVTAGPPATLALTAPASATAGTTFAVTATAKDAYGNAIGDVTSQTAFTLAPSGSCAGASCSDTVAGAHTLSAADGAARGSASVSVNAGSPATLALTAPSSVTAGQTFAATVTAKDAYGNAAGDVTSQTAFTLTPDGSCTGAHCRATVAGSHSLSASDGLASTMQTVAVDPGALDHLQLSPSAATVAPNAPTAPNADFSTYELLTQSYRAIGFDVYGNSLGDVTQETQFAGSGDANCIGQTCSEPTSVTNTITGSVGAATGTAQLTGDSLVHAYAMTCQGDYYDLDGSIDDGCEVAATPAGDHTEVVALSEGSQSCADTPGFTPITGNLPSDARVHADPSLVGFDPVTGSAPDWFSFNATGGDFCVDDVAVTLTMSASAYPSCYKLTVVTDKLGTLSGETNSSGVTTVTSNGASAYTDASTVYLEVQKVCSLPKVDAPSFTITGHL